MPSDTGFSIEVPQEVVRQAQAGDINAFEEIYNTYSKACYLLAWRISGNEQVAQDLVQDTFIKVMNKINKYRFDGLFAGWLRQITVREAINKIKAETKLHLITEEEIHHEKCKDLFNYDWLDSCHDLEVLTRQLSKTARAVLFLHEVEGYNHKEIASFFNKSESFSKVTLSRAYNTLKQNISESRTQKCI